jgi:hypothetical protein
MRGGPSAQYTFKVDDNFKEEFSSEIPNFYLSKRAQLDSGAVESLLNSMIAKILAPQFYYYIFLVLSSVWRGCSRFCARTMIQY